MSNPMLDWPSLASPRREARETTASQSQRRRQCAQRPTPLSFVPPFASLLPSPVSPSLPLRHPSTASLLLRSTGTHAVRLPTSISPLYSTSNRPPQLPQVPDNSGRQTPNTASEPYHSLGSRCRLSPSKILIHAPRPRRLWSSGMQSGRIAAAQGCWSVITCRHCASHVFHQPIPPPNHTPMPTLRPKSVANRSYRPQTALTTHTASTALGRRSEDEQANDRENENEGQKMRGEGCTKGRMNMRLPHSTRQHARAQFVAPQA
ncbi:hypothetical protein AB1N83_013315 [Pleurotus pulmonarius]